MSLIAVIDQVDNPVYVTIQGTLHSAKSNLLVGQETEIFNVCTDVNFQIISPFSSEELTLFADGPCKDAELSKLKVNVTFLPCSCPNGFVSSNRFNGIICDCTCDPHISQYVTECNSTTQTFQRSINVWISYINRSLSFTIAPSTTVSHLMHRSQ